MSPVYSSLEEEALRNRTSLILDAYLSCGAAGLSVSDFLKVREMAARELGVMAIMPLVPENRQMPASAQEPGDGRRLSGKKEPSTGQVKQTAKKEKLKPQTPATVPEKTEDAEPASKELFVSNEEQETGSEPDHKASAFEILRNLQDPWN